MNNLLLHAIESALSGSGSKPKVLVFDVNETLLDLAPLKKQIAQALGDERLVGEWFSTLLHYSLVHTLTQNYMPFGQIGANALLMLSEREGQQLSAASALDLVETGLCMLSPYPDVVAALSELHNQGFTLVTLTNSSIKAARAKLDYAQIHDQFDQHFTVEPVMQFKPAPAAYQQVFESLEIKADQAIMIAAHPWDLMGARAVGMQTCFVRRPGKANYPGAI